MLRVNNLIGFGAGGSASSLASERFNITSSGSGDAATLAITGGIFRNVAGKHVSASTTNASGTPDPPEATTTEDGCIFICFGWLDDDAGSMSAVSAELSNETIQTVGSSGNGCDNGAGTYYQATQGAFNPSAYTGGDDAWEAMTFAMNPSGGTATLVGMFQDTCVNQTKDVSWSGNEPQIGDMVVVSLAGDGAGGTLTVNSSGWTEELATGGAIDTWVYYKILVS